MRTIHSARLLLLIALSSTSLLSQAAPDAPPQVPSSATSVTAAAAAAEPRFDIGEFEVVGNTQLSDLQIERAVYPFLGPGKTFHDADLAREALEAAYHEAGFQSVFVDIPEQAVDSGVVRLSVLEGEVERLRITGSRYHGLQEIRTKAGELAEARVPYFPAMQKQLGELNTSADLRVTPVLRPGKTPGKLEVELKVEDKLPLHGALEFNNHYSKNTSQERLAASVHYDNLWQQGHSIALNWQMAPDKPGQTDVVFGTYALPLNGRGDSLAFYAVKSNSNVATLGDAQSLGKGTIAGVRYTRMLPSRPGFNHTLTLGWDYKDFDNTTLASGVASAVPMVYMPWLLQYGVYLNGENSSTKANLSANFAPRGLGNRDKDFYNATYASYANYIYFRGDLRHQRNLADGWVLAGRLSGQAADQPLYQSERFAIGGAESVRGYREAEAMGDYGLSGSVEMRLPTMTLGDASGYLLAFLDAGAVRRLSPTASDLAPVDVSHYAFSSVGMGWRVKFGTDYSFDLDLATRLKADTSGNRGLRLHFRLATEF